MSPMDSEGATTSDRSTGERSIRSFKERQAKERENLVLTKKPLVTLKFFSRALFQQFRLSLNYVSAHRLPFLLSFSLVAIIAIFISAVDGPHKLYAKESLAWARYVVWWVSLGVASSIGLGSGLHTFVLYLGPHVALFTMRATQCGRVDFKCAPYDTAQWGLASSWAFKDCNQIGDPLYPLLSSESGRYMVPLQSVLAQVQLEAVLWGIGTALGELPPYFMSRQAQLVGQRLKEVEELVGAGDSRRSTLFDQFKLWMVNHLKHFGFFTILLFASVPNPLFDLAGILCGQLLVPFWKFFTATLIGKAFIKTHIQTISIIMVCNPYVVELVVTALAWVIDRLPAFAHITPAITAALHNAESKFSNVNANGSKSSNRNVLALVWNTIVFLMMLGFASSIISSIAQGVLAEEQYSTLQALETEVQEPSSPPNGRHDGQDQ